MQDAVATAGFAVEETVVAAPPPAPRWLPAVLEYMEAHLAEGASNERLAELSQLSAFHFARAFRRAVGISPHQYLIRRRVERALALLAEADRSVSEAALLVGFSSQSHLHRHFVKVVGMTPGDYRRRARSRPGL